MAVINRPHSVTVVLTKGLTESRRLDNKADASVAKQVRESVTQGVLNAVD